MILRFRNYQRYFFKKWAGCCVLSAFLVLVQLTAILLSGLGLSRENTWMLPAGSPETELFEVLSQMFSSPLTAFAGCTGYLFLGIWLISGLCMWLTHFAGHRWTVRILVSLYILSILWIKIPLFHVLPVTGLNHLVIFHHNLGSPTRWITTGITVALLLLCLVGIVRFPMKTGRMNGVQRRGVQAYYQRALIQKRNLTILCTVVLGMIVYKGLGNPSPISGREWVYHLFSGHGTGTFRLLAFLELLLVNTAPLYLIAVFIEASIREQSIFVAIRARSRTEIFHGILRTVMQFTAIYAALWFLLGVVGGLFFVDALKADSIPFLLGCAGLKFLDILVQALVMLLCYLLTKQITVGFLVTLAGNLLCALPQKWAAYLLFGLSSSVRVDWLSLGLGIPVWTAGGLLSVFLAVLLVLLELLGSKKRFHQEVAL